MKEPTVQHDLEPQRLTASLAPHARLAWVFACQVWPGLATVQGDSDWAGDVGPRPSRGGGFEFIGAHVLDHDLRIRRELHHAQNSHCMGFWHHMLHRVPQRCGTVAIRPLTIGVRVRRCWGVPSVRGPRTVRALERTLAKALFPQVSQRVEHLFLLEWSARVTLVTFTKSRAQA